MQYMQMHFILFMPPSSKKLEYCFWVICQFVGLSYFSYQQDLSITYLSRALKLGQLIGAEE